MKLMLWLLGTIVISGVTAEMDMSTGMSMGSSSSTATTSSGAASFFSNYPPGAHCVAASSTNGACMSPAKFVAPLFLPPVIDGRATGTDISLTARKGCIQVFHNHDGSPCGSPTEIWGYDGQMPGPTIMAQKGTPLSITHINQLGQDYETNDIILSTHHHGLRTLPAFDGHPSPQTVTSLNFVSFSLDPKAAVFPNQSFTYRFNNDQEPGTFWYHDHSMHTSARNVIMGLAAFYWLLPDSHSRYDNVQDLPSGPDQIGLVFQDRSFIPNTNQFDYPMNPAELKAVGFAHIGYFGQYILVNGVHQPYLNITANRWYRFRFLNACNARQLRLYLDADADADADIMYQIGTEGGHISKPRKTNSILMVPGERYDVLIDFTTLPIGTKLYLKNDDVTQQPQAPNITDIMEFRIVSPPDSNSTASTDTQNFILPAGLVDYSFPTNPTVVRNIPLIPPIINNMNAKDATSASTASWTIAAIPYDPNVANLQVRKGTTERWVFSRQSSSSSMETGMHINMNIGDGADGDGMTGMMMMDPHPMHIHLVQFHVDGVETGSLRDGWKDILMVPANGSASLTATFDGEPGIYLFHCHNLEHEDTDMMLQFQLCEDDSTVEHACDDTLLNAFTEEVVLGPSSAAATRRGLFLASSLGTLAASMTGYY